MLDFEVGDEFGIDFSNFYNSLKHVGKLFQLMFLFGTVLTFSFWDICLLTRDLNEPIGVILGELLEVLLVE